MLGSPDQEIRDAGDIARRSLEPALDEGEVERQFSAMDVSAEHLLEDLDDESAMVASVLPRTVLSTRSQCKLVLEDLNQKLSPDVTDDACSEGEADVAAGAAGSAHADAERLLSHSPVQSPRRAFLANRNNANSVSCSTFSHISGGAPTAGAGTFRSVRSIKAPDFEHETSLFSICSRGHHTAEAVQRCETLLQDDKGLAKQCDEDGKLLIHLLCEVKEPNKFTVDLCTAVLAANKGSARHTVGNVDRGGLLPIHLLCSNEHLTEHSDRLLVLVLKEYEEAVEVRGGARMQLPVAMLCDGKVMSRAGYRMFKRLVEASKDSLKEKNEQGRTLAHQLCQSTAHAPHSESSVDALRLALEFYKRAAESQDLEGLRPLHVLCASQVLTAHSVNMCKMLLDNSEATATAVDDAGMLALHHLCAGERLSEHSLDVLRKLLEVFEKGAQIRDCEGRVGLHLVCAAGHLSKVSVDMTRQLLLAHKRGFAVTDERGRLPLHYLVGSTNAARTGLEFGEDVFDMLLWTDKAGVETSDAQGRLPLHALCACGLHSESEISILEKLTSFAPSTVLAADSAGDTPLHLLCESQPHTPFSTQGFQQLAEVMLHEHTQVVGAEVAGAEGRLALHCLCRAGQHTEESVRMFEVLVQENPHGVAYDDKSGMTPIHWLCAAQGHTTQSVHMFNQLMAAMQERDLQVSTMHCKDGLLPVHLICAAGKHTQHSAAIYHALAAADEESVRVGTALAPARVNSFVPARMDARRGMFNVNCDSDGDDRGHPDTPAEGAGSRLTSAKCLLSVVTRINSARSLSGPAEEDWEPAYPLGRRPLHFLCGAGEHTAHSLQICNHLITVDRGAVWMAGDDGQEPLHLLCTSDALTKHSVDIGARLVKELEGSASPDSPASPDSESDLRPLLYICQSPSLSEYSVQLFSILRASQARQSIPDRVPRLPRQRLFPLHSVCGAPHHSVHSVQICKHLLCDHKEWAKTRGEEGMLPLHVLAAGKHHTHFSVQICLLLITAFPLGVQTRSKAAGFLPIHYLCENDSLSINSCKIAEALLQHLDTSSPQGMVSNAGLTPLHHLCATPLTSQNQAILARQLLLKCPLAASMQGQEMWSSRRGAVVQERDVDLPLHRLCQTQPHTEQSVKVCRWLVSVYEEAISSPGRQLVDENMATHEEEGGGDVPLMMLVKGDKLTAASAAMSQMLVSDDEAALTDVLTALAERVYRPKGDEVQQRMALRLMICLAFLHLGKAVSFLSFDESLNGAHSISFLKEVADEMAMDTENPLHHVLRIALLYRTLAENEPSSVIRGRLMSMSETQVQWAVDMVDELPGKVSRRAIWTPEKESTEFLMADSPIGIALELGDLKIVSHGAVCDVVFDSWPGDYSHQYNPFAGTVYNNMLFEFSATTVAGKAKREFRWTWETRVCELLSPVLFFTSPMMMYWLGIFYEVVHNVVFHIVLENSSQINTYHLSLGPAAWYLVLHLLGGVFFEIGQIAGEGVVRYSQDPWNVIDIAMYLLLSCWLFVRVTAAAEAEREGRTDFVPDSSSSTQYLGLAAIFIWLRTLNAFGIDPRFGPLVRTIQGMVFNVLVFLALLLVFLLGFSTALKAIFRGFDLDDPELEGVDVDVHSFQTQQLGMVSLLDMSVGNFELIGIFQVSQLAFWVICVFLVCTFIMLFNLLIALMTDTYSDISGTSEQIWKKDRALLMGQYIKTEKMSNFFTVGGILMALPQPLNLPVMAAMLLLTPPYLYHALQRNTSSGKAWPKMVNHLLERVIQILLGVTVCVPLSCVFVFVGLPLNWIVVGSRGFFEYLGVSDRLRGPQWLKRGLSQVAGVAVCPLLCLCALVLAPACAIRRQLRKLCARRRSDEGEPEGSKSDLLLSRTGSQVASTGGDGPHNAKPDDERRACARRIWEQQLDDDDKAAL